jgi:hypothetical protein
LAFISSRSSWQHGPPLLWGRDHRPWVRVGLGWSGSFSGIGRQCSGPRILGQFSCRCGCNGRLDLGAHIFAAAGSTTWTPVSAFVEAHTLWRLVALAVLFLGELGRKQWCGLALKPRMVRAIVVEFTGLSGVAFEAVVAPVWRWRCCRTRGVCQWGARWQRYCLYLSGRGEYGCSIPLSEILTADVAFHLGGQSWSSLTLATLGFKSSGESLDPVVWDRTTASFHPRFPSSGCRLEVSDPLCAPRQARHTRHQGW